MHHSLIHLFREGKRLTKADKKSFTTYGVRFGQVAVRLGLITVEQLKDALCEQVEDDLTYKPHRLLGDICCERGWMTSEQIKIVLKELSKDDKG